MIIAPIAPQLVNQLNSLDETTLIIINLFLLL